LNTINTLRVSNTLVLANALEVGVKALTRAAKTNIVDTVDGVKYTEASLAKLLSDHLLTAVGAKNAKS
jgi:hypothetical protein